MVVGALVGVATAPWVVAGAGVLVAGANVAVEAASLTGATGVSVLTRLGVIAGPAVGTGVAVNLDPTSEAIGVAGANDG